MFVRSFRIHIGTLYFQVLITTAMAHGGMTVGANLEIQFQQLILAIPVSLYILFIEAIVLAQTKIPSINHDVAHYPATQEGYEVRPLPGILYAQLIGAGISTFVNIFVMPSTSSRKLVGAFRSLVREMHECCEYFDRMVPALGIEALGRRLENEEAPNRRLAVRKAAEVFGRVVGGSRYEITIERFSQMDYHRIFQRANKLASSFGTMCLPYEIDKKFHSRVERHANRTLGGTMTNPINSMTSVISYFSSEHQRHSNLSTSPPVFADVALDRSRPMVQVAELHRRREIRRQGIVSALVPIRAQLSLHRQILGILLERTEKVEKDSPTRSLFEMVVRAVNFYTHELPGDIGHSASGVTQIDEVIPQSLTVENPQMAGQMHDRLDRMSLEDMARVVQLHAKKYEQEISDCIRVISPYNLTDESRTHERNVTLLSFIGALRENAVGLAAMLYTLHQIDSMREQRVRIWFPRLNLNWLYRGRADEDDEEEEHMSADAENWDFANAFGADLDSIDERDEKRRRRTSRAADNQDQENESESDTDYCSDSEDSSQSDSISENLVIANNTREQRTNDSIIAASIENEEEEEEEDEVENNQSVTHRPEDIETKAIYEIIEHPAARLARVCIDWLNRPKTRYAIKFTVAMMIWAIWAFIRISRDFFIRNNASWGLSCIAAVLGVTIGSTMEAGLVRVLGVTVSGAWAIVVWKASSYGSRAILPCTLSILYFVIAFFFAFYRKRWSSVTPIMVISFSSVLFSAYVDGKQAGGTSLGWKHVAVNIIAIVFAFFVSALFMPYKARTALRRRLAEIFHLNSRIIQSINHMHVARAEFPLVHHKEYQRVEHYVHRSRVLIAKCRSLVPAAEHEPSVHEKFQTEAHQRLINMLELQLEWMMYSFFRHSGSKATRKHVAMTIRLALTMREDIIGAKSLFNSILASALHSKTRLPAYLPDIETARHEFIRRVHPLIEDQYAKSFDVTYLSRWHVGLWHIIATQTDLCLGVRAIVGAETDKWPEEVGFMLDSMEVAPPGQVSADNSSEHPSFNATPGHENDLGQRGKWFRRLPKYALNI
ncbi:hypothetical protein LPJ64_002820 [Coemansia asiatica]|uniref:Uncharacterized protein n=1 Tax=Coemansia asiatica TaxID=1052880 RepID=A0A9W7XLF2_9FUNG|nr:hypothetical protein LPJ64_002820 [Coemansia asiatica]